MIKTYRGSVTLFLCIVVSISGVLTGVGICSPQPCIVPDNGTGTVDLPADCRFWASDDIMHIYDGLPPGTTIDIIPIFENFQCMIAPPDICEAPGGNLGGSFLAFGGDLFMVMLGTGELSGFYREITMPMFCEIHLSPRTPGDPIQPMQSDLIMWEGQLFGDPDFNVFQITAGTNYGLPCPGQTILTGMPGGEFDVDSFFDILYRIDFEGAPGSILDGMAGANEPMLFEFRQGVPMMPTPTPTPEPCLHHGDIDFNTDVTAGDAQIAFNIVLSLYTPTVMETCAADCNNDGQVTADDAQQIFGVVFGGSCADPV